MKRRGRRWNRSLFAAVAASVLAAALFGALHARDPRAAPALDGDELIARTHELAQLADEAASGTVTLRYRIEQARQLGRQIDDSRSSVQRARDVAPAVVAAVLASSILLPYETYFYAAGAIENRWKPEGLGLNRFIVIVGFSLGALLGVGWMMIGAQFFGPWSNGLGWLFLAVVTGD